MNEMKTISGKGTSIVRPRGRLWVAIVAVGIPAAALVFGARGPDRDHMSSTAEESSPRRCLENMLAAEKAGDAAAYLSCFSGRLREELETQVAATSGQAHIQRLRNDAAALTGYATTGLVMEGTNAATVTFERIFARETETCRIHFRRRGSAWTIVAVEPPERTPSPIPYGTPVFAE